MPPTVQDLMLEELREINRRLAGVEGRLEQTRLDVSALKVKAGLWGVLGGVVVSLGTVVLAIFKAIGP